MAEQMAGMKVEKRAVSKVASLVEKRVASTAEKSADMWVMKKVAQKVAC